MFKNIDKKMMLKLALLHVVVITVSNYLVSQNLLTIAGQQVSAAAFTFPFVVLATDLTVRILGKNIARATIAAAYPFAILASIAVVLSSGAPQSVALLIGFASGTAYGISTLLDVYVFQYFREKYSAWWIAPALSTVVANVIDTYTFYGVAFSQNPCAVDMMGPPCSANWTDAALSHLVVKIIIGLIIFLPAYGILLRYLKGRMNDTAQG